jgi:hypothetical protein
MGLTVHYDLALEAPATKAGSKKALDAIAALGSFAMDLPFETVSGVFSGGADVDYNKAETYPKLPDDMDAESFRWWAIQGLRDSVDVTAPREKAWGYRRSVDIDAQEFHGFSTWPGEGCEAANFGLVRFPRSRIFNGKKLKAEGATWRWNSFCKTQYANDPRCGGLKHFLECHLCVIAILDKAKELGILARVSDESGYWDDRDLQALVGEIAEWDLMIAGFGAGLRSAVIAAGGDAADLQSSMDHRPGVEQLEAKGFEKYRHLPALQILEEFSKHTSTQCA